jgi:hypothetical protein
MVYYKFYIVLSFVNFLEIVIKLRIFSIAAIGGNAYTA